MHSSHSAFRISFAAAALAVVFSVGLSGCKSKEDKALEQAKAQAAATGQAQQVVYTDANGNTVTTTVQPPAPGQTAEAITTTVTPKGDDPSADAAAAAPAPVAGTAPAPLSAPVSRPKPVRAPASAPPPAKAVSEPVVRPAPLPPLVVPAGTSLTVRIDQRIAARSSQPGDTFSGEFVEPVMGDGTHTAIPKGALVAGVIDAAQGRGHFKGAADLQLRLTSVTVRGRQYALDTNVNREQEKGKGKRTAGFIGGGAGLGALIGGLAGGGKGALIGGLAGAGAGTAGAGLTGNGDLVLPAESIVHFTLANDLEVQQ